MPSEWYWTDVPLPTRAGGGQSSGAGEYARQMRGVVVLTTLDRLGEAFWGKRTWEISRSEIAQPGYAVGAKLDFDPERDG